MAEFTPITIESQEQLDGMFKDRLNRQSEKHSKEILELKAQISDYEALKEKENGYLSQIEELNVKLNEVTEKVSGYDAKIAERDEIISQYKLDSIKNSVLNEMSLPSDAINFLTGADEEEIRKSAESLKSIVGARRVAPLANSADIATDNRTEALKTMLNNLTH